MKKTVWLILSLAICLVVGSLLFFACGRDQITIGYYSDIGRDGDRYEVVDGKISFNVPTVAHYTFLGLYDEEEGGNCYVDASGKSLILIERSMPLYGHWKANECTIEFDPGEGTLALESRTMKVTYNTEITGALPIPTAPAGYDFIGWKCGEDLFSTLGVLDEKYKQLNGIYYTFTGDKVTLVAAYERRPLTVTFDFLDSGIPSETVTVMYGEKIREEDFPARDTGTKEIVGWRSSVAAVSQFDSFVKEDITLYAMWSPYLLVRFYEVGNTLADTLKIYDGDSRVPYQPTRDGYSFKGWYSSSALSGSPISYLTYRSGVTTCFAKWEVIRYNLTYVTGYDATVPPATFTVESTFALPTLTREHYTFRGWSENADLGGTVLTSLAAGTLGDKTFYAVFKGSETVINLDSAGGRIAVASYKAEYGRAYALPIPEREHYVFLGWFDGEGRAYTDNEGNGAEPWSDAVSSLSLTARWAVKRYAITYQTNGGTVIDGVTVDAGAHFVVPEEPTKGSLLFAGWFSEDGLTEYTQRTEIYADTVAVARWSESVAIYDAATFLAIASAPDGEYHLTQDVNMRGEVLPRIAEFTGVLDGRGYTIKNFNIVNVSPSENTALFGVNRGTIKNLTVEDFTLSVKGDKMPALNVGVLVGKNFGTIREVNLLQGQYSFTYTYIDYSEKSGDYALGVGGLVGVNETSGVVEGCATECAITASLSIKNVSYSMLYWGKTHSVTANIGGVVGQNKGSLFSDSDSSAITVSMTANSKNVEEKATNILYLGGVAGRNASNSLIEDCHATSALEISATKADTHGYNNDYVGEMVGANSGTIRNCYATGRITGGASDANYLGGFVAHNTAGSSIANCYAGAVFSTGKGGSLGGFVAKNDALIQNCYSTGDVKTTASAKVGGFSAENTNTGTISKCYSTGNVTVAGGTAGRFAASSTGILNKCYYLQSAGVTFGGNYVKADPFDGVVSALSFTQLWSEEFLVDTLYWDQEGWVIFTDDNPILQNEFENDHDFRRSVVEPDCTHGGFATYDCADCDKLYITDFVQPTGHAYEVVATIPPACETEGYTEKKCSVCGDVIRVDVLPATGHPESARTVKTSHPATCLEDGYYVYHCELCGNDYRLDEQAKGHSGTYVRTVTPASCGAEGEDVYLCDACHEEYAVVTEKLEHTWIDVEYAAPTCGAVRDGEGNVIERNPVAGNTAGVKCSVCGAVRYGCAELEPHSYVLLETVKQPSCAVTGSATYKCSICEYEETKTLEKIDHTDGNGDYVCDVCGHLTFSDALLESFTHIGNKAELVAISENLSGNYWLDVDIDLAGEEWTPIGTQELPFKGIFYGGGHMISNVTCSLRDRDTVTAFGLFAYSSGYLIDVRIGEYAVTTYNADVVFGALVAYNKGHVVGCTVVGKGTVDCVVELVVTDYAVHTVDMTESVIGALVGVNRATGEIRNCRVTGEIAAEYGNSCSVETPLAQQLLKALIYETAATASQQITFGGLVGRNEGLVESSIVSGKITLAAFVTADLLWMKGKAHAYTNIYAGALTSYCSGTIKDCSVKEISYRYATGAEAETVTYLGQTYEVINECTNHSLLSGVPGVGFVDKAASVSGMTLAE